MVNMTLKPLGDNVIVELIEADKQIGSIIIPDLAKETSTLAKVVIPNKISYQRNGEERKPFLKSGTRVRLPKGNVGTGVPEAPEGKTWLCVPEDLIYYIVED